MSKGALSRRTVLEGMGAVSGAAALAACGGTPSGSATTLEFQQWWEPELPDGFLRDLMDRFEQEHEGVTVDLLSGPYAATREQLVAGAASGTMPDVVGLDDAWVHDLSRQGALADLDALMADASFADDALAATVQVDGTARMIPVVTFAYLLFTNRELLASSGIGAAPETREEFLAAAEAVVRENANVSGWALPLSLEAPNGVKNDVMSWLWASGGSMLTDGAPALEAGPVAEVLDFILQLQEAGVIAAGTATMKEQDKVETFISGQSAMIVDTVAHLNMFRQNAPDLEVEVSALPTVEGFDGTPGVTYASWGIGVAESSQNQQAAWDLVAFLLRKDINAELSEAANAFPGVTTVQPEGMQDDEVLASAFEIWGSGEPTNEFAGLPVAEKLMRDFAEQLQRTLAGEQTVEQALAAAQGAWADAMSE